MSIIFIIFFMKIFHKVKIFLIFIFIYINYYKQFIPKFKHYKLKYNGFLAINYK